MTPKICASTAIQTVANSACHVALSGGHRYWKNSCQSNVTGATTTCWLALHRGRGHLPLREDRRHLAARVQARNGLLHRRGQRVALARRDAARDRGGGLAAERELARGLPDVVRHDRRVTEVRVHLARRERVRRVGVLRE